MRKIYLLILSFLFTSILGCGGDGSNDANPPATPTTFAATYGDSSFESANASVEATNGDFILAGIKSDSTGSVLVPNSEDAYIVKTNPIGNMIWSKLYGGNLDDGLSSIKETPDGGFVAAGYSYSFSSNFLRSDAYLIRIDIDGNLVWFKTFDEGGSENILSIQITANGDYIMAGVSDDTYSNIEKFYLIRTDSNGNKLWSHMYSIGSFRDIAFSVQETTDGGFIVAGKAFLGAIAGQDEIAILKTDEDGNELWQKTFGGPFTDWARCVLETSDGGFAVVGSIQENQYVLSGTDMVLIKTDPNGNEVWRQIYEGQEGLRANSINKTSDGGYVLLGGNPFSVGDSILHLIKTDENGNEEWRITHEGEHGAHGNSVQETEDNGFLISGAQFKLDFLGFYDSDAFLLKTTANGSF